MSLEWFFRQLSSVQRDQLAAIVAEASSSDSRARVEAIDSEIDRIRVKLDDMHREREALKERLDSIERILAETTKSRPDDLEVAALKLWLTSIAAEVRRKLGALRPEDDLQRKRELTDERSMIVARQEFVTRVQRRLRLDASPVKAS